MFAQYGFYLVTVGREIKGDANAGEIRNVSSDLIIVLIVFLFVPLMQFGLQLIRALCPMADDGSHALGRQQLFATSAAQGCRRLIVVILA